MARQPRCDSTALDRTAASSCDTRRRPTDGATGNPEDSKVIPGMIANSVRFFKCLPTTYHTTTTLPTTPACQTAELQRLSRGKVLMPTSPRRPIDEIGQERHVSGELMDPVRGPPFQSSRRLPGSVHRTLHCTSTLSAHSKSRSTGACSGTGLRGQE